MRLNREYNPSGQSKLVYFILRFLVGVADSIDYSKTLYKQKGSERTVIPVFEWLICSITHGTLCNFRESMELRP